MLQLIKKIKSLAESADWPVDMIDIGCTITNAMDKNQIADLSAMIQFLESRNDEAGSILSNVMHDINGLRAVYFGLPEGNCFSPRSSDYRNKIKI